MGKKALIVIILMTALGTGLGHYFNFGREARAQANSFDACVKAGYFMMGGHPRRCLAPDGRIFVEKTNIVWRTLTDSAQGLSFRYPEALTTKYIYTGGWPPKAQIVNKPFVCVESGSDPAEGVTKKRRVGDRTYCMTRTDDGGAGSIYSQYAYAFAKDGKTAVLTFTLTYPGCGNFDAPGQRECEAERKAFDVDRLADGIARTLVLGKAS